MPRDVSMKEQSEAILKSLARFSPAYELYDGLRKQAEAGIAQAPHVPRSQGADIQISYASSASLMQA